MPSFLGHGEVESWEDDVSEQSSLSRGGQESERVGEDKAGG